MTNAGTVKDLVIGFAFGNVSIAVIPKIPPELRDNLSFKTTMFLVNST